MSITWSKNGIPGLLSCHFRTTCVPRFLPCTDLTIIRALQATPLSALPPRPKINQSQHRRAPLLETERRPSDTRRIVDFLGLYMTRAPAGTASQECLESVLLRADPTPPTPTAAAGAAAAAAAAASEGKEPGQLQGPGAAPERDGDGRGREQQDDGGNGDSFQAGVRGKEGKAGRTEIRRERRLI